MLFHIEAALKHEGFEAFFAEFLGSPATGDPGADDDGIEGMFRLAFKIEIHGF